MDPREQGLLEATLHLFEVELGREAEKKRLMEERLRADQAAIRAKERERSRLMAERDGAVRLLETGETLLVDAIHQLETDGHGDMDSEDRTAMMQAIATWMKSMNNFGRGQGHVNSGGGSAAV